MSEMENANREDKLLTLIAKPLTRMILEILVGIDPGRIKEEILEKVNENSKI
jgi:hypothetical protein